MLRLKPRYRLQVPHGLAMVGALLLLAGTVTGVGNGLPSPKLEATAAPAIVNGGERESVESSVDAVEAIPPAPMTQKKRLKMNLFLFRR
jgi:hypothetical protein